MLLSDVIFVIVIMLVAWFVYNKCRRIRNVADLPWGRRGLWLSGIVTNVRDGDGFRFYHVPWFRSSEYAARDPKLAVRLAGIDAPESAFFGMSAQPFLKEARDYLRHLVLGKEVKIKLLKVDRYGRLLVACFVKKYFIWSVNVNLEMVKAGLACVYTGTDAEYDEMLDDLQEAESNAKLKKLGMWAQENYVSPMDHKKKWRKKE